MHFLPSSDFTCFDSNGARENSGEQQVVDSMHAKSDLRVILKMDDH